VIKVRKAGEGEGEEMVKVTVFYKQVWSLISYCGNKTEKRVLIMYPAIASMY
jgi:hypothetical protein